jgi:hypothetical protein
LRLPAISVLARRPKSCTRPSVIPAKAGIHFEFSVAAFGWSSGEIAHRR